MKTCQVSVQLETLKKVFGENVALDIDTFTDVKPNINNLGDLVYNFLKERNKDDGIPKEVITNKVQQLLLD